MPGDSAILPEYADYTEGYWAQQTFTSWDIPYNLACQNIPEQVPIQEHDRLGADAFLRQRRLRSGRDYSLKDFARRVGRPLTIVPLRDCRRCPHATGRHDGEGESGHALQLRLGISTRRHSEASKGLPPIAARAGQSVDDVKDCRRLAI